jgi:heptaprenyl diphosphate synthase/octaprenyl-diphosphate synthase
MNVSEALRQLAPAAAPISPLLFADHAAELAELERRLGQGSEPPPIRAMAAELFEAGGKRLRGLVAIGVARAFDLPAATALSLAELVELTHAATLLHDDVIDDADRRRGRPAARIRWSNTLSVLGGDFLLLRALERVAEIGCPALDRAHRETLRQLLAAEVAQNMARRTQEWSVDGYLDIAQGKTGALFALGCSGPALCAEDRHASAALDRFGRELGVAFQIADDLRDLLGLDPTKPAGLDLGDGVPSLPIRLAAAKDGRLRARLAWRASSAVDPTSLASLRRAVVRGGAAGALALARAHLGRAEAIHAGLARRDRLGLLSAACAFIDDALRRCEVASS